MSAGDAETGREQVWLQPFPDGMPVRITNDLSVYERLAMTRDGSLIAALKVDTQTTLTASSVNDISMGRTLAPSSGGRIGDVSGSPAGVIAYALATGNRNDIAVLDTPGGTPRVVTSQKDNFDPSVTSDGRTIIYAAEGMGEPSHVFSIDVDGSNFRQLTQGKGEYDPHASGDGKALIYSSVDGGELWLQLIGTSEPRRLTERLSGSGRLSPDGRHVVFLEWLSAERAAATLKVVPVSGGPSVLDIPWRRGINLRWQSNSVITFQRLDRGASNLYGLPITGGEPTQITRFPSGRFASIRLDRRWHARPRSYRIIVRHRPDQRLAPQVIHRREDTAAAKCLRLLAGRTRLSLAAHGASTSAPRHLGTPAPGTRHLAPRHPVPRGRMRAGEPLMTRRLTLTVATFLALTVAIHAQFRRGMLSDSTEITLYPLAPPAVLLPEGTVRLKVRNGSGAAARVLERVQERLARQLADNDERLEIVPGEAALQLVATITEWKESRRNSTKYVSETRQVGTREVVDKNGKKKTEPVYESGRNRPSVVISALAGLRIEVRTAGEKVLADESVTHAINDEYLVDAGPPSRDEIQDLLIDGVVQRGAARVTPGRQPVRVALARADAVERLNPLAQDRKWTEWLKALEALGPHRDQKREAYRAHNMAVAHEALAYEAGSTPAALEHLRHARALIADSLGMNSSEKYFNEAGERIVRNAEAYEKLAGMYQTAAATRPLPASGQPTRPSPTSPAKPSATAVMTNADVIDLRKAGLDDDNLVAAIKDAPAAQFDLSPAALKTLLDAKISNKVIAAMRTRAR